MSQTVKEAKKVRWRRDDSRQVVLEYLRHGVDLRWGSLIPQTLVALARAAVLLSGVIAAGWPVGLLGAFLAAETFLVIHLTLLADRFGQGRRLYLSSRTEALGRNLFWTPVALGLTFWLGWRLDQRTDGGWFQALLGVEAGSGGSGFPWGPTVYLLLLGGEIVREVLAARREGRTFAPRAAVTTTLFIVGPLLGSFGLIVAMGLVEPWFGDSGVARLAGSFLLLCRLGAELGVIWLPFWGPRVYRKQLAEDPTET